MIERLLELALRRVELLDVPNLDPAELKAIVDEAAQVLAFNTGAHRAVRMATWSVMAEVERLKAGAPRDLMRSLFIAFGIDVESLRPRPKAHQAIRTLRRAG